MNRFDSIPFDTVATEKAGIFLEKFKHLEELINEFVPPGPYSISASTIRALEHLEIASMFINKAIRDEQIMRAMKAETNAQGRR